MHKERQMTSRMDTSGVFLFLLLLYLITDFLERLNEVVLRGFACVVDDGDLLVVH